MDYALRFNGTDNHVALASSMPTSNAGTTAWFIEFRVAVSSYPATGNWYFIGSSAASASGVCLRQASGDGALAVVVGGGFRFATNAGYVPNDGIAHTYRIEHDAGGATRFYKDQVLTHVIAYTVSASWALGLFGNTSAGSAYFPFDLISASMQIGSSSFLWNASLANGTGLVLPSTDGLNNGTLVGTYVNDSQWVGLPEPTKYAMTTVGQGGTAYLAFPVFNVNQNANTFGVAKIRIEFKLDSFQGKAFAAILGNSGSSQTYIRVNQATMALEWMFGNVLRIESPSNAITLGTRHVIEYTFDKATTVTTITLDGIQLPSFAGGATAGYSQIGRFHTVSTMTPELTLYALSIDGATYLSYLDAWDGTSERGVATGVDWTSLAGNRLLTITEATGAADSWWVEDGVSPPADLEITLGTIDSTAQLYNATVAKDKLVNLEYLAATTTVYTPSVTKEKLIFLEFPTVTTSVFNPSVLKDKRIDLGTRPSSVTMYNPTVTKGSSLVIGPSTITSSAIVREPTLRKDLLVRLLPIGSTASVFDLTLLKDKWISLEYILETSGVYDPEVLGGAVPLPKITLFTDEGFGLHIRSAEEMNDMILALAKRIQILENKDV